MRKLLNVILALLISLGILAGTAATVEAKEGFDINKETYGEYELIVFRDQTSPLIVVYMEKNGTYIAITGQLSMEQIHSIIDSLVVDESI